MSKPILDVEEVSVSSKRVKGAKVSRFSNGHVTLGDARVCFQCHLAWPNLWDPLTPCAGPCAGCASCKKQGGGT